jgi:calcium/calmodulin-dependent protein kinase I
VLLKDSSSDSRIKIADFGFARHVKEGCVTACGTPGYVAPEVISGKIYNVRCDTWSLGVLMYILLCGYPPFYAKNRTDLFKSIRKARYHFDSPYWDAISDSAKDLISKLLVVDPKQRYSAEQTLQHPWIQGSLSKSNLQHSVKELRIFNAKRHLRAGFRAAIAAGRIHDLVSLSKKGEKKPEMS